MINAPVTVVERTVSATVQQDGGLVAAVEQTSRTVTVQVQQGVKGDPGPVGASGAGAALTATATEPIGGHRVVQVYGGQAAYADKDLSPVGQLGLTSGAVDAGGQVVAYTAGEMIEPSWEWTMGPVFLGNTGLLTQGKPTSGTVIMVGRSVSPTAIIIDFQHLYKRT